MSYDVAISDLGDLILTASRDLAGISGSTLLEQRMKLRLRLHRGEWKYDYAGTLGSLLYTLSGIPAEHAATYVDAYVREALLTMQEISVADVQTQITAEDITLIVVYQMVYTEADDSTTSDPDLQELTLTLPIVAANE